MPYICYYTLNMKIFKEVFQRHRKVSLATSLLLLAICIIYISFLVQVLNNSTKTAEKVADAIIVLGHAVDKYNEPSPWLYERLISTIYLYERGFSNKIIVTGGRGPTDDIPVAYIMRNFLVLHGVASENILIEASSRDTFENFNYAKIIAKKNDINSIIFVTNNFHVFRSLNIARHFFEDVQAHGTYAKSGPSLTIAYLREPISIIYNKLWKFFR